MILTEIAANRERSWEDLEMENLERVEIWEVPGSERVCEIWKFQKRKGFIGEDAFYLYVASITELTARIKWEVTIPRLGFDFKTWRQSLKQT